MQGYARQRTIAVSPVAALPFKTTIHELAHVCLGHTSEGEETDGEITPRNLRECEAEAVALLCCAALELAPAFRLLPRLHPIDESRRALR